MAGEGEQDLKRGTDARAAVGEEHAAHNLGKARGGSALPPPPAATAAAEAEDDATFCASLRELEANYQRDMAEYKSWRLLPHPDEEEAEGEAAA